MALLGYLLARANAWRPVRVVLLYITRRGPLLAAGASYRLFFAIAAMLVAGFSLFGLVAAGNTGLQTLVVSIVDTSTPGLINTGDGGLVTPKRLFSARTGFGWALTIATITMLVTSLSWIAGLRQGMRAVFDLPPAVVKPVLRRLKDLGTLLILAVALVVTSVVAGISTTAVEFIANLLNFQSRYAVPLTTLAGIVVMLLLDMIVAVVLFRLASEITMPRMALLQSALIAGVGSTLLRTFSSLLLQNVGKNPVLESYAVILGLLVWFFLLSQVYLIAATWGAVATTDTRTRGLRESRDQRRLSLRQRARLGRGVGH